MTVKDLSGKEQELVLKINIIEEQLDANSIEAFKLYEQIIDSLKVCKSKEATIKKRKLNKRIFGMYLQSNSSSIEEFAEANGIVDIDKFKESMDRYRYKVATSEEKETYNKLIKEQVDKRTKSDLIEYFQKFLTFDENIIFEYLYNKHVTTNSLNDKLKKYIMYIDSDYRVRQILEDKIRKYNDFYNKRLAESKQQVLVNSKTADFTSIKKEIELLRDVLESKESIRVYGAKRKIRTNEITSALIKLKVRDRYIHDAIKNGIEQNTKEEIKQILLLSNMMQKELKSGIEEDGIVREFDVIDYYKYTSIPPKIFITIVKENAKNLAFINELIVFAALASDMSKTEVYIDQELMIKYTFEVNGEIFEVPNDAKQSFIDYLKENNIPINNHTYGALQKRYINKIKHQNQEASKVKI